MIKISNRAAKALRKDGFGKYITVVGKGHKSNNKSYYVVEDEAFMKQVNYDPDGYGNANGR